MGCTATAPWDPFYKKIRRGLKINGRDCGAQSKVIVFGIVNNDLAGKTIIAAVNSSSAV